MSPLGQEKGESSRNAGPSGLSTEVQLRQNPAATAGSSFRTNLAHQDTASSTHPFSGFIDQPGSLPPENTTHLGGVERSAITEMQAADGSVVIDLLSRPDDDDPTAPGRSLERDISPETIESLRAVLSATNDHEHPVSWDNLLNFTPDYVLRPSERVDDVKSHFGSSYPQSQGEEWLQQWGQVLTSYTDDVWGDLLPLVTQARQEHETLNQESPTDGPKPPKALNRLRMILAHIQNSGHHF